jgi:hypothetical protein
VLSRTRSGRLPNGTILVEGLDSSSPLKRPSGPPEPLACPHAFDLEVSARAGRLVRWLTRPDVAEALATLIFTIPAWGPVLLPTFALGQVSDGTLHLHRSLFLAQLLKDGNWFSRWMPQQFGGYGYPTFNFYAPGLYYLVVAFGALSGQGLYFGMQLVTGLACVGIVLGVYLLAWVVTRHAPASFAAASAVAYGPYAIQGNVYLSGSMTHVLGLTWMALLLAACAGLWRNVAAGRSPWRWWWAAAGCTAAVFLSHNAVAAVTAVVAMSWVACLFAWRPRRAALLATASAALVGVLAVAFFWVPALTETSIVQIENNQHGDLNYHNQFLTWPGYHREEVWGMQTRGAWTVGTPIDLHLLYPNSLYGPVRLGIWQAVVWGAGGLVLVWQAARYASGLRVAEAETHGWRVDRTEPETTAWRPDRRLVLLATAYGLFLATACYSQTFDWALPWWDRYAVLRSIQLPSRLLAPAMFGLGLTLAGTLALCVRPGKRAWFAAVVASLCLAVGGIGARHIGYDDTPVHEVNAVTAAADARTRPGYTDSMDEFLPRSAGYEVWHENEARGFWIYQRMFPESSWVAGRLRTWQGNVTPRAVWGRLLWTAAELDVGASGATVAFHQLAFPGWRAWVDGQPVRLRAAPELPDQAIRPGFVLVDVPPGRHTVSIRFGTDLSRSIGAALSIGVLLGIGISLLIRSGVDFPLRRRTNSILDATNVRPLSSATRGWRAISATGGALLVCAALTFAVRTLLTVRSPVG